MSENPVRGIPVLVSTVYVVPGCETQACLPVLTIVRRTPTNRSPFNKYGEVPIR